MQYNKAKQADAELPRFNRHQNLIKDEVFYAQVQQSKTNLEVFKRLQSQCRLT
jgi:hypothetical protein